MHNIVLFSFPNMNEFWTALAAVVSALGLVAGAYRIGFKIGYRRAAKVLNLDREKNRFCEIYAPSYGLFTTCHITTASARGAPYIRQRLRNALSILVNEHRPQEAVKALFDKQDLGISGEVEYGTCFPLAEITKLLRNKEHYADRTLLNLVARANRAQSEDMPSDGQLTDADLSLFHHISSEHEALSRRFTKA
jgi:hypothetical protein